MEKLTRKLILEILNEDDSSQKEIEEQSIEEPIEIEEPVELNKGEKVNFILSVLSDLNNKALDMFNCLTPYITNVDPEENLSEDNKNLLTSVYEDVSLILGKLSQGLKDNSPVNIQNAIDDGQTLAQETITPEVDLKEDLNSDKEKLWNDLMGEVDMGDFFDNMQGGEKEEKEKFLKDPKKELQNWKEYYKENSEMLDKIKAFEDKYFKE